MIRPSPAFEQALETEARAQGLSPQALLAGLAGQAEGQPAPSLYVSAPVNALVEGIYREDTTVADVLRHGDLGLGTFNDLDGEMVVMDGEVHQLRSDGEAYAVSPDTRTPFAAVTFFRPYSEEQIREPLDYPGFIALLDRLVPSKNMVYALRVEGRFASLRTRSVPRQDAYRPLVEVAREQPEFDFTDVEGTLVGFWTPSFLSSVAVPGYHLHFLTADRRHGGHLLECAPVDVTISLQHLPQVSLGLPMTLDYLTAEFGRDTERDLDEAEH